MKSWVQVWSGMLKRNSVTCLQRSPLSVLIFFLQAKAAIRDYKVTGVQTCALPISVVKENAFGRVKVHPHAREEGAHRGLDSFGIVGSCNAADATTATATTTRGPTTTSSSAG